MMINSHFLDRLDRYGDTVTLRKGTERYQYKAFVFPVRDRNRYYLEGMATAAGVCDRSYATYYSACENGGEHLAEGDMMDVHGQPYLVRKCSDVFFKDHLIYRRALLESAWEEEHDGIS